MPEPAYKRCCFSLAEPVVDLDDARRTPQGPGELRVAGAESGAKRGKRVLDLVPHAAGNGVIPAERVRQPVGRLSPRRKLDRGDRSAAGAS